MGEANFDKLTKVELVLDLSPARGSINTQGIPSYTIYTWAETYNVLRVYGGRAGLLFNYAGGGASSSASTWNSASGASLNTNC